MDKLYNYLKTKVKSKHMILEQFASKCGFSKSTLYRYMRGTQTISAEIEQKFCEVLNFNDYEKQEFHNILNSVHNDVEITKIRDNLNNLIFNQNKDVINTDSLELILYDRDRYIRTIDEVFEIILRSSECRDFICEINMIGCISQNIIYNIQKFINHKNIKSNLVKFSHIVNIADNYCNETVEIIKTIYPFFQFSNYNVYYTSYESGKSSISILDNLMIIKYKYNQSGVEKEKYIFISFLEDRFSGCYPSEDINLYNFFIQTYNSLLQKSKKGVQKFKNFVSFCEFGEEIEENKDIYSIYTVPSYNKLPIDLIEFELSKYSNTQLINLVNYLSDKKNTIETSKEYISYIINILDNKSRISKSNKEIDIYSKEGIKNFISTGILNNYISELLPISKQTIKIVMNNLIERSLNSNDNYKMYITNDTINSRTSLKIIKEYGIIIGYYPSFLKGFNVNNSFIENKSAGKIFADFVESYINTSNVMNDNEAYEYIQQLLNNYC